MKTQTVVAFIGLWAGLAGAHAEPRAIGTATSGGSFRLNGDTVVANGTLTDGAILETYKAGSLVRLTRGVRFVLAADSRATLYSDRLVLAKGEARLENGSGFHLEALGLTIRPDAADSTGRIGLLSAARLRVDVLTGSFQVLNSQGASVANVAAGTALAFEPQQPASAAMRLTGMLVRQNGHFLLRDEVSQVTVEITGSGLERHVGARIQVTGVLDPAATPVSGASQVVRVTQVRALAGASGGAAAPAGASAGGISATTIAVIAGVAVAATVGGLAANDLFPGQGEVSR